MGCRLVLEKWGQVIGFRVWVESGRKRFRIYVEAVDLRSLKHRVWWMVWFIPEPPHVGSYNKLGGGDFIVGAAVRLELPFRRTASFMREPPYVGCYKNLGGDFILGAAVRLELPLWRTVSFLREPPYVGCYKRLRMRRRVGAVNGVVRVSGL